MNLPEKDFEPTRTYELEDDVQKHIKEFGELLSSIKSADNRLKILWQQIYDNAVTDRKNSYCAFADLYMYVHSNADMHAIHGLTLSKYLERMEKSNAQLLKLVELIDKAAQADDEAGYPSSSSLFELMEQNKTK